MHKRAIQILTMVGLLGIGETTKGVEKTAEHNPEKKNQKNLGLGGAGYCSLTFQPPNGDAPCPSATYDGWTVQSFQDKGDKRLTCIACLTQPGVGVCSQDACNNIANNFFGQYKQAGLLWTPWYHPTCIGYTYQGCNCNNYGAQCGNN